MSYPENLKYTKEHEWVLVEGDQEPSASPITRKMNWATSSLSICPKVGTTITKGQRPSAQSSQ
jgi:glycine cleavage system H lipoate-binding protein